MTIKFTVLDGKAEYIELCSNRETDLKFDCYDLNWNKLDMEKEYSSNVVHKKPENFEKMIEIAENLSKEFKYVRVDLYNINGKIYFGELTFSPAAGFCAEDSSDYLGEKLKLDN